MYTELIVNVTEHETRVALLEDGKLAEIFIERGDEQNISSNIYKGRVQRVLPGMQAAFIDIGLHQASFLYIDDLIVRTACDTSSSVSVREQKRDSQQSLTVRESAGRKETPRIEHLLTEGRQIIVQIAKAPIGNKGARVTTHISLPGRFLVLMPMVDHIGISRRIEDEEERERLKNMIADLRHNTFGYIVRTAAEGVQKEQLEKEMRFLLNAWNLMQKKSIHAPVPSLLHEDLNVTLRAIRDLLTQETDKLVIDSRPLYISVVNYLNQMMPDLSVEVECYTGSKDIFDFYHIENEIYRSLQKKVWLKSGGYIVIEHTEALVAIDVNTGRYVGKKSFDETIFNTNLEAVWEIAHQIRLRNIGGIIIIDFIDMNHIHDREKIFNALKDAMQHDKCRTRILPMSEMGLIQMTRKRVKKSINRTLCEPCFYCGGNGFLLSRQSICYKIYRKLVRDTRDMMGDGFVLRVHPEIADYLHQKEYSMLHALERKTNGTICIQSDFHLHLEEFQIFETIK